jgi:excisionase family DNA binding protein
MDDRVIAVSVVEAARRLGVSPRTMATLLAQKKIRSRTVGRRRLIPISALEEFLAHDTQKLANTHPKP